jgi:two-component system, chemotaxis family, response regulator WspF
MPIRIAIVHHDTQTLDTLKNIIGSSPDHQIVWMGSDGPEALRKCNRDKPDILLVDLTLTGLDAIKVICSIMQTSPCAIIVLADSLGSQSAKVFEAMGCGALDAVQTPLYDRRGTQAESNQRLLKKIATIGKLIGKNVTLTHMDSPAPTALPDRLPPLIVIGSSTGGPKALADILASLPRGLGAAIVIVQHLDVQFAKGLAGWLNPQTHLTVSLAEEGMRPRPDTALVAATNDHIILGEDLTLHYTVEPRDYPYRPSVNTFFESVKKCWPQRCVAVLLTGMGRDGAEGLAALRKAGWHTITQDEKTSVVYGMPAAAVELGAAEEILPLDKIGPAIMKWIPSKHMTGKG